MVESATTWWVARSNERVTWSRRDIFHVQNHGTLRLHHHDPRSSTSKCSASTKLLQLAKKFAQTVLMLTSEFVFVNLISKAWPLVENTRRKHTDDIVRNAPVERGNFASWHSWDQIESKLEVLLWQGFSLIHWQPLPCFYVFRSSCYRLTMICIYGWSS